MDIVHPHVLYCQVLFVSEKMVIGVGFDCNPMVFAADETGIWYVGILCLTSSFIQFIWNGAVPYFLGWD